MSTNDETFHPDRRLDIEGTYNVRDIGGYLTRKKGRTRWKQFLRSDTLSRLTQSGRAALIDYGLRTVIDLRRPREVDEMPNKLAQDDSVTYLHIDFIGDRKVDGLRYQGTDLAHRRADQYHRQLEICREEVGKILAAMSESGDGAILFHCAGGKDRTGMIAALLLGLADVPEETIVADYALTAHYNIHSYLDLVKGTRYDTGATQDINTWEEYQTEFCPPGTMRQLLIYLEETFGGIEGYVRSTGLTDQQIRQLREKLTGSA